MKTTKCKITTQILGYISCSPLDYPNGSDDDGPIIEKSCKIPGDDERTVIPNDAQSGDKFQMQNVFYHAPPAPAAGTRSTELVPVGTAINDVDIGINQSAGLNAEISADDKYLAVESHV